MHNNGYLLQFGQPLLADEETESHAESLINSRRDIPLTWRPLPYLASVARSAARAPLSMLVIA
jgi:hypothetical protein